MAKAARGGRWWRPGKVLGPAVLACGLLGSCGGSTPSAPTTPGPTPTAHEPVSAGFLHVLHDSSVVTYRIDAATGQLRPSATQTVGDAHTLTGEPQGRHVFAAYGPRSGASHDPSIVAYAPDPSSGSLMTLSEASSDPIWCPGCAAWGRRQEWYWLSASSTRVYAMWLTGTYHDDYHTFVTHAVGNDGRLGPAYQEDFSEWDPGTVAVDVDADVFYKGTWTGGVTAHFVESDGRLTRMGGSHLCVASTVDSADPLVAVRGFLFASSHIGYDKAVCSWEGPRLAPRSNLGLQSDYAVALAPRDVSSVSSSSPASRPATLVAMRMDSSTTKQYEVRLFALSDDGDPEPLDTITGSGWARHLLFHPSGRFLYLSHGAFYADSPDNLTVYSIDSQGHLAAVQTLDDGGGAMAVTLPPVRASAPAR